MQDRSFVIKRPGALKFLVVWATMLATGWTALIFANSQISTPVEVNWWRTLGPIGVLAATSWLAIIWPPQKRIGRIAIDFHLIVAFAFIVRVIVYTLPALENMDQPENFGLFFAQVCWLAVLPIGMGAALCCRSLVRIRKEISTY